MKEADLIPPVIDILTSEGWFTIVDVDGTDYFDIACVKGSPEDYQVMLVELKLNQPKTVYIQAFKRRWHADYICIGMPKLKSLQTVHRYDIDKEYGLIEINEIARWYHKPKKLIDEPQSKERKDRIAGTLFAIKEGIIEKPPSATFMMWGTSTIMGKTIEKYTKGWPHNIRDKHGHDPRMYRCQCGHVQHQHYMSEDEHPEGWFKPFECTRHDCDCTTFKMKDNRFNIIGGKIIRKVNENG